MSSAAPSAPIRESFFSASLPSISAKEIVLFMALYPFYVALSAFTNIYALMAGNAIAIGLHVVDWVKELSTAKKITERTSKGRERLDHFFQQILFAIRNMLILMLLFSLQFTFIAICGTIHSIYSALFKKDGSVTGRFIRWICNGISHLILGVEIFDGPEKDGEQGAHHKDGEEEYKEEDYMAYQKAGESATLAAEEGQGVKKSSASSEKASEPAKTAAASVGGIDEDDDQPLDDINRASSPSAAQRGGGYKPATAKARGLNPNLGSGAHRKSSAKGLGSATANPNNKKSTEKCQVISEGAHFNRVARGCLLPPVE